MHCKQSRPSVMACFNNQGLKLEDMWKRLQFASSIRRRLQELWPGVRLKLRPCACRWESRMCNTLSLFCVIVAVC